MSVPSAAATWRRTVTRIADSCDAAVRQRVLDAAIAELITTNAASFTMAAVAKRAGLDLQAVRQMWPNTPELLNAALLSFGDRELPAPDTGCLRDDLLEYAKAFAPVVNSPTGRRILAAVIATPKDWDVSGWRPGFSASQGRKLPPILRRAVERGDCSPDLDTARVVDLFYLGVCGSLLFYDRPVTDEDCEVVVDILLNGILRKQ